MLDSDLAELYDVENKALKRAVRRNMNRFPDDFMFQLTEKEHYSLRYQSGTLKVGRGQHSKYLPFVFTQEGVAMLSSILNSERSIQVNITIMRAFVNLREVIESNSDLAKKIDQLEGKFQNHDADLKLIFKTIREMMFYGVTKQKKIRGLGNE